MIEWLTKEGKKVWSIDEEIYVTVRCRTYDGRIKLVWWRIHDLTIEARGRCRR